MPVTQSRQYWLRFSPVGVRSLLGAGVAFVLCGISLASVLSKALDGGHPLVQSAATLSIWLLAALCALPSLSLVRALSLALVVEGLMPLYQFIVIDTQLSDSVFHRIGPSLLALFGLLLRLANNATLNTSLWRTWLVLNVPCILLAADGVRSLGDNLVLWLVAVVQPIGYLLIFRRLEAEGLPRVTLCKVLVATLTVYLWAFTLMLPVELRFRGDANVFELQYGARNYHALGILMLMSPFVVLVWNQLQKWLQFLFLVSAISQVIMSFGRGVAASSIMLFILLMLFGRSPKPRRGGHKSVLAVVVLFVLLAGTFLNRFGALVGDFWLLRLNARSNLDVNAGLSLKGLLEFGRSDILGDAFDFWTRSPLIGHGIGSISNLFLIESNGVVRYSGAHNLLLTIMVERGLLGLVAVLLLFGRWLIAVQKLPADRKTKFLHYSCFAVFLVYASSTGVEMILVGSRILGSTVSTFVFLTYGLLTYRVEHITASSQRSGLLNQAGSSS